jgi:uroporphyrinogen III methyltransferase/synthase
MDLKGSKILLPRAAKARDVLPEGLKKLGASVDVVATYQTVNSGRKKEELEALINESKVDVITFTSSSTVTNFVEIMGDDFVLPAHIDVACIGPVTAATAKKAGFKIDILHEEYTMEGLVHSLITHKKNKTSLTRK